MLHNIILDYTRTTILVLYSFYDSDVDGVFVFISMLLFLKNSINGIANTN